MNGVPWWGMPSLFPQHRHQRKPSSKLVHGITTASQVGVNRLVGGPARVFGIGRCPTVGNAPVLPEPKKPALSFCQQLFPFPWTKSLLLIPTVKIESGVPTSLDLVLAIQALLHIDVVKQVPANQPEMLGGFRVVVHYPINVATVGSSLCASFASNSTNLALASFSSR